jgi:hypothetical protein
MVKRFQPLPRLLEINMNALKSVFSFGFLFLAAALTGCAIHIVPHGQNVRAGVQQTGVSYGHSVRAGVQTGAPYGHSGHQAGPSCPSGQQIQWRTAPTGETQYRCLKPDASPRYQVEGDRRCREGEYFASGGCYNSPRILK